MNGIKINIEGINNIKTIVKQMEKYLGDAQNEIKHVNNVTHEYNTELVSIMENISKMFEATNRYNRYIDDIINKFKKVEILNENIFSQVNNKNTINIKSQYSLNNFANVGRIVPAPVIGGGRTSKQSSSSNTRNTTSLSQAEVDYREGRAPGMPYNQSSTSNKSSNSNKTSNSRKQNNSDDSAQTEHEMPKRDIKAEAEAENNKFLKGIIEQMNKWRQFGMDITSGNIIEKRVKSVVSKMTKRSEDKQKEVYGPKLQNTTKKEEIKSLQERINEQEQKQENGFFDSVKEVINKLQNIRAVREGKVSLDDFFNNNRKFVLDKIKSDLKTDYENKIALSSTFEQYKPKNKNLKGCYAYDPGIDSKVLWVYLAGTSGNKFGKDVFFADALKEGRVNPDVHVLLLDADNYYKGGTEDAVINETLAYAEEHGCENAILSGYSKGATPALRIGANVLAGKSEKLRELLSGIIVASGRVDLAKGTPIEVLNDTNILVYTGNGDDHSVGKNNAQKKEWLYSIAPLFPETFEEGNAGRKRIN